MFIRFYRLEINSLSGLYFRSRLWTVTPMDEGTILVYCCPSTVPSLWPPPPPSQCTVYADSVWLWWGVGVGGGMLNCAVNHILQEFYTLFLTRFRTYKIASPPQTKMTSKDDIKGLMSLKFLRLCLCYSGLCAVNINKCWPSHNLPSSCLLIRRRNIHCGRHIDSFYYTRPC